MFYEKKEGIETDIFCRYNFYSASGSKVQIIDYIANMTMCNQV